MSQMAKAHDHDGRVTLENGLLRLEFDLQDHGALASVVDVATGVDLIRDPAAPHLLWRLELRRGGSPEVERVLSSAAGEVSWTAARTNDGTTLTLAGALLPDGAPEVGVQVTLPDESPLSPWRATVRGLADDMAVTQLACPVICGLAKPGDPAPGEALVAPVQDEAYLFRNPFPVRTRREYGQSVCMMGGVDKREIAKGKAAIDAELAYLAPAIASSGYIPTIDHSLPPDIPYANFCYYWERKKEMLGIGGAE